MKPTSMDIPVHDIGPLLEILEYSFVWFMALIAVTLIVITIVIKQMYSRKKGKKPDERRIRYENFSRIDVSNAKTAAYAMCEQGLFFAHDNEETLHAYHTLFECLESYKYAPKVEPIDEVCLVLYRSYCQMIVV